MKIIATNIGERKEIDWKGKIITTGIFKYPVDVPVFLDKEDVKGDVICNRAHHGGIEQAVYGYSEAHYDLLERTIPSIRMAIRYVWRKFNHR